MPFSGPDDSKLPSNVRRLPVGKRRQWVAVWNSTFSSCRRDGGSVSSCEGRAFPIANGVVKELGMTEPAGTAEPDVAPEDERSIHLDVEESAIEYHHPLGGATSFADAEAFIDAQSDLSLFKTLLDNIMHSAMEADEDIGAAVERLGREFAQRQRRGGSRSILDRVLGIFKVEVEDDLPEEKQSARNSSLFVLKDLQGRWRWLAITTNQFYDREGEVITEEAHREHEAYLDRTKEYPELRLWHIPGTRVGRGDFFAYTDGFVLTSGTFDPGYEDSARALFKMRRELGVSHGFTFPTSGFDEKEKAYHRYRMIEVSPLPFTKAANPWTDFAVENMKEVREAMALEPDKKAFLEQVLGEERTARVEEGLSELQRELKGAGVTFKEIGEGLDPPDVEVERPDEEEEKPEEEAPEAATPEEVDESAAPAEAAAAAGLDAKIDILGGKMEEFSKMLDEKFGGIDERLESLERTDDEKVAAAMRPKSTNGITRPSDSKGNVIEEDEAKEVTDGQTKSEDGRPVNPARAYVEDAFNKGGQS